MSENELNRKLATDLQTRTDPNNTQFQTITSDGYILWLILAPAVPWGYTEVPECSVGQCSWLPNRESSCITCWVIFIFKTNQMNTNMLANMNTNSACNSWWIKPSPKFTNHILILNIMLFFLCTWPSVLVHPSIPHYITHLFQSIHEEYE